MVAWSYGLSSPGTPRTSGRTRAKRPNRTSSLRSCGSDRKARELVQAFADEEEGARWLISVIGVVMLLMMRG